MKYENVHDLKVYNRCNRSHYFTGLSN